MNKVKIEIKNRWTGDVMYEYEKENNTLRDTLEKAVKEGANLEYADLRGANLVGGNLVDADLRGANLEYADLRYANLRYANLRGANLEYADLRGANLEYADLRGANLEYADLRYANLRYANLRGANLRYANLRYANLRYANLRYANLRGANLEYADLRGAYLFMWDNNKPNISKIIENIENNSSLRIKSYHINKHVLSPVSLVYWKNGLIIDDYEIIEPKKEIKKMTLSEVCEQLGYDIEIVKEH